MPTFCHSCGAPLEMPEFKGKHENYCEYCMGDDGIFSFGSRFSPGLLNG